MESIILLSGTYLSQSGVELKYSIEQKMRKNKNTTTNATTNTIDRFDYEDEEGNIYIVAFQDNAYSASIAKLSLNTWSVLEGQMFFITCKEYLQFLEEVVDKDHKWTIKDSNNHLVELPGRWFR